MPVLCVQSNLTKTNFRGPTNLGLIIRISSYQDMILHVQYYSKPNRAWKLVCVKQKLVLGVFFLIRFYCTTHRYCMHCYTHRYCMHYYTQVLYALLHTGIVYITTHRYIPLYLHVLCVHVYNVYCVLCM